ncbi:MAG: peptidylprolyl isomerase [Patescibacteria group bacterium]|jgi:hypothetical protein
MTVVWHHEYHRHARYVAPGRWAIAQWLVFAFLVIAFLFGGGWFFWFGWRSGNVPSVLESFSYAPIGFESGHVLWYAPIARLARGIAAADGRATVNETDYAQAIDATIRRNALDDLAHDVGVSISDADVESSITWTDDIRTFQSLAGWSDYEYRQYIVEGFVLSTKVEQAVLGNEEYQAASHERVADIQAKLTLGIAFEDVAKEYSEDPATAQAKGSFGYVLPSEVDAAFAPVFDLPLNTATDVISTVDAYWILRIEDTAVEENGVRSLLRGIAIKKTLLADVLDEKIANIHPLLWVR